MITEEQIYNFHNVFAVNNPRWGIQKITDLGDEKGFRYAEQTKSYYRPNLNHYRDHFCGVPIPISKGHRGSLSVYLSNSEKLKMICIDADNEQQREALLQKVVPELRHRGADPIIEYSGQDRAHVWVKVSLVSATIAEAFISDVLVSCGMARGNGLELFPLFDRRNHQIRIPGGYHQRTKCVNKVEYRGQASNTPEFVIDVFCKAGILSNFELRNKAAGVQKHHSKPTKQSPRPMSLTKFVPLQLSLTADISSLPIKLRDLARNCQVINSTIDSVYEGRLDQPGCHATGLMLGAIVEDLDSQCGTNAHVKWFEQIVEKTRRRDASSHNWTGKNTKSQASRPHGIFPSCNTLGETLGGCEGCEFRGISSPKLLLTKDLKRELEHTDFLKDNVFELVTLQEVRERAAELVVDLAKQCFQKNHPVPNKNILFKYFQGAGKTASLLELAEEASKAKKKCLFVMSTHETAREVSLQLERRGLPHINIASYEHIFGPDSGNKCPEYKQIQDLVDLGESSNRVRTELCSRCPVKTSCSYFNQYAGLQKHNIAIIQHAHLSSKNVMQMVANRHFDVMLIDEDIVDKVAQLTKWSKEEMTFLKKQRRRKLVKPLYQWFCDGSKTESRINLTITEKRNLRKLCTANNVSWRDLLDKVNLYNAGAVWTPRGIFMLNSLPDIPLKIFADATADKEVLRQLVHGEFEVHGDKLLLDYPRMHKGNKIVQSLTSSVSKTALRGGKNEAESDFQLLSGILDFVVKKVSKSPDDYRALLTVYKSDVDFCKKYFENEPEVQDKLTIASMEAGTNRYAQYDCQFLAAGVFTNDEVLKDECLRMFILQRWASGPNMFDAAQFLATSDFSDLFEWIPKTFEVEYRPVRAIHQPSNALGRPRAHVFEYPELKTIPQHLRPPIIRSAKTRVEMKTQQAIRIRFDEIKPRMVYFFGRCFLPGFLVSDPKSLDQILGFGWQSRSDFQSAII